LEVHGYADASSSAYAAVVYLRVIHSISNSQVSLICAKTKVAPVKIISISSSRIKRCCAVKPIALLDKTRAFLIECFDIRMDRFYDNISMVETTSLQMEHVCCQPSLRGADFVSRRDVAACSFQGKLRRLRRGLSASMLSSHDLWWNGPTWLKGSSITWPRRDLEMSDEQTRPVSPSESLCSKVY